MLQERLRGFQTGGHHILIGLRGTALDELPAHLGGLGFHHHDGDILIAFCVGDDTTGNNNVEDSLSQLRVLREGNPLVTDQCQTHRSNGTAKRQPRDLSRRTCSVDRQGVIELVGCDGEDSDHNLDLVAQTVDKRGAQRPVDQTADQNRLGRGATLTTEKRSGNLPRRVGTLFDVHGQREKVKTLTRALRCARCREQHRVFIQVCSDRTLGLLGQAARFKAHCALSELAVIQNGFSELDFWTFH